MRDGGVRVLFIAAEREELAGLLAHCTDLAAPRWPVCFARTAMLNGVPVAMVANGAGPRLAGAACAVPVEAAALVSTGSCGALDPALSPGEIVAASSVNGTGCERPCTARAYRWLPLTSKDRLAASAAEKQALYAQGAAVVEMEAAAVAASARDRGIPFYCIRAVLDAAAEGFVLDFNRLRDAAGRFSRPRIVAAALRRPLAGAGELLRLARRGRLCARNLGDFLADCRF